MMKQSKQSNYTSALIIIGGLFFMLGFVTWLNGKLIPFLQNACELTNFQALLVTFAFYISYTIMALPSSLILNKTGFKKGISMALFVMALGALMFIYAASTRVYFHFLTGLFVLGSGMALLQTAVNPYVTVLGPSETAAKRISIMGVANKIAGALAPVFLAVFLDKIGDTDQLKTIDTLSLEAKESFLNQLALRVQEPYWYIFSVLLLMALAVMFVKLPSIDNEEDSEELEDKSNKGILAHPNLWLGAIALFFYVGVEVVAGDTVIKYAESAGFKGIDAASMGSYTMLAMLVGYILGILFIPKVITQAKALQISAVLGLLISLLVLFLPIHISVYFVASLGLANALVWPAIWPLALEDTGKLINIGSALLIMAIAGGAILSLLWGKLADISSLQTAYWVLIPSYLIIYYYSVKGYKLRT
jgi:FHS family L-fucose permease-like MFS transporter